MDRHRLADVGADRDAVQQRHVPEHPHRSAPGGEIRGQLVGSQSTRLTCQLSGANEVPPNASTATGTCTAFLHEPDNRLLYVVETQGVTGTAAHVHQAAVGVNGPIVVPLNGGSGSYCGVSDPLTAAEVAALQGGGMDVNVHSTRVPRRRDPRPAAADRRRLPLQPRRQPGGAGQQLDRLRRGIAARLDADGSAMLTVSYAGLSGPATAAHIHTAAFGVNGPVTVPLVSSGPGQLPRRVPR